MRECWEKALTVTSTPRVTTLVLKAPSSYFPYPAKIWINGHEWAKRQAAIAGIAFDTDLDERRAEVKVLEVEVVARDPPTGLGEGKPRDVVGRGPFGAGEHRGELLGHPDRGHPGAPRSGPDDPGGAA
jgi:hypothetical protein